MWVYPNYKQGIAWSYLLDEICLHLKYTKANNYNMNGMHFGMHFVLCIKGFFALNLVMFQTLNNSPIPWILAEYLPLLPQGGGGGQKLPPFWKPGGPGGEEWSLERERSGDCNGSRTESNTYWDGTTRFVRLIFASCAEQSFAGS